MGSAQTARSWLRWFACVARQVLVPLLAFPATGHAQLTFTTNNDQILVTGYIGNPTVLDVPSSTNGYPITRIEMKAFYNCGSVTNITIPDSVLTIGSLAFFGCSNLVHITIGSGVSGIGLNQTFGGCLALTSLTIGSTNVGSNWFTSCTNVPRITLLDSVITIENEAFNGCAGLTDIQIPESVTTIGSKAFEGCSALNTITLPDSVSGLGPGAFYGCRSLKGIMVYPSNPYFCSIDGVLLDVSESSLLQFPGGIGGSYTTPATVTNIASWAFGDCGKLTNITIGNTVTSIGSDAFHDCTGLTNIMVPNSVTHFGPGAFNNCASITIGSTNVGDGWFSGTVNLGSVKLLDSVISIGIEAFQDCRDLTNVTLGNGLVSIGGAAFIGCSSLTSITIPDSVTAISYAVFEYCSSLRQVTLGRGLSSLPWYDFVGCSALGNITIPRGISFLGNSTFCGCTSLTNIFFMGDAPSFDYNAFCGDNATVYYLPGTTGWSPVFGGLPALLWNPQAQINENDIDLRTTPFGFDIVGTPNIPVVVQACTNFESGAWVSLGSLSLTNGSCHFTDPQRTSSLCRYYRLRAP